MAETLSKPINIPILMEDSDNENDYDYPYESKFTGIRSDINSDSEKRTRQKKTRVSFSPKQTVIEFEKYLKSPQEEKEEEERILAYKNSSIGEKIRRMFRFKGGV